MDAKKPLSFGVSSSALSISLSLIKIYLSKILCGDKIYKYSIIFYFILFCFKIDYKKIKNNLLKFIYLCCKIIYIFIFILEILYYIYFHHILNFIY